MWGGGWGGGGLFRSFFFFLNTRLEVWAQGAGGGLATHALLGKARCHKRLRRVQEDRGIHRAAIQVPGVCAEGRGEGGRYKGLRRGKEEEGQEAHLCSF